MDELVCNSCMETDAESKTCTKCSEQFCACNASSTDVRMCKNCLSDFRVVESVVTKTTEILNSKNEVIQTRVQHARQYTLEGTDWLFTARRIVDMNDQDLENTIEYHRACMSIMLNEREHRRMEKAHQLAKIKVIIPTRETQFDREERDRKAQEKADAKAAKGNTKRTSTKSKDAMSSEALVEILMKLKKAGLTAEQIQALAGKK